MVVHVKSHNSDKNDAPGEKSFRHYYSLLVPVGKAPTRSSFTFALATLCERVAVLDDSCKDMLVFACCLYA